MVEDITQSTEPYRQSRPLVVGDDSGPKEPFPIRLAGTVQRGFGRGGKDLNCPTANMSEDSLDTLRPVSEPGIYYGYAQVLPLANGIDIWTEEDSKVRPMVMSLGWNPFYKNKRISAEIHIMHEYLSDFYNHPLRAIILGYIRPELDYVSRVPGPLQYQYTPTAYGYPDYSAYYAIPPPVPPEPAQPSAPVVPPPTITTLVASQTMRRLLATQLRHTKETAMLCNRGTATIHDALAVCVDRGITTVELRKASMKRKRKQAPPSSTRLVSPPPREPSPDILPSDDEDATPIPVTLPQTLQDLPDHLPSLPPKHTYLHTAPAAFKRIKAPSLDRKLDNASKVQQALRHLVKATEEGSGRGDFELASGVVNWKVTPDGNRKRWKLR
ncbi:hypothetical protein Clacol_001557 [Clathrus columnatus]|uniref:Riboflavin kinase n=1 Tax=Clathrus columnatus TaxID=1419009 RepID=A0AAV5A432_9AGAM|nr:hypothetical protein Clacol_001557 [Clathrus columnatus]